MRISVLTENTAGHHTPAEHGLSYLVEHDGKRILFDTGQSDLFLKNAGRMKVGLKNPDAIVLSHGHYDHGDGLGFLEGGTLVCHPGCFVRRYSKPDSRYIGLNRTKEELAAKFKLITAKEPFKITDKILFAGEIPRLTDFESNHTSFVFEDGSPDFVTDDSALILILDRGLFVVTGCGHAGIVNTIEHARKITGISKIHGVMGGFHLKEKDLQTAETKKYLRSTGAEHVLPSHCTELPALSAFHEEFGLKQVKTGYVYDF
ncbi:MAG: MBL fold metallo-hydrolase [Bacteroidales bacterium]|nr:MBL fold metallo-hydrolase [Bacteroidales bacterium]